MGDSGREHRDARGGRTGLLLVNLGTPDAPRAPEVRRYLAEFLSDPRVIDLHPVGRWLLLNLVVLPFRPARSAAAWEKVWTAEGSPLLAWGRALERALAARLADHEVVLAMRYGRPSIAAGLEALRARGCDRIVAFPLYPQYASSSTGSCLEVLYREAARLWNTPSLAVVPPFYDRAPFVRACAARAAPVVDELDADHVLFSFHGLPERHVKKSDETGARCLVTADCCARVDDANRNCYRAQCFATARAVAARLGLDPGGWSVAFQSRLGRTPWIRPFTDEVLPELAARGVRRVAVSSPSFVADCLETLEEIGLRAAADFRAAGGEELRLVPSLNDDPAWVEAAAELVREVSPGSATASADPSRVL